MRIPLRIACLAVALAAITCLFPHLHHSAQEQLDEEIDRTDTLMQRWWEFAERVPLPRGEVSFSVEEAVAKMNVNASAAFPNEKIHFRLRKDSDPVPPGFQLNPQPHDWSERDQLITEERRAPDYLCSVVTRPGDLDIPGLLPLESDLGDRPMQEDQNTLLEQTTTLLNLRRYRVRVFGSEAVVFRQDTFLPRLRTKSVYPIRPGTAIAAYFAMLQSRPVSSPPPLLDLSPILQANGIIMIPGAEATFDRERNVAILTVPEVDIALAEGVLFPGGCAGPNAVSSRYDRTRWQVADWWEETSAHFPWRKHSP